MDPEQFPANSRVKKEEPKTVEKVVTGKVTQRKKPLGRRFLATFVENDAPSVGRYVVFDILIPAFKDVVADVVSQGIESMLFGSARSTSRRTGARPGQQSGHVSYNRYSSATVPWNRDRRDGQRQEVSKRARGSHDFDEIILATRAEAEEVIDRLFDLISKYQQATVADLYELTGLNATFTDERWGWVDFRGAGVQRVSGGYLLDLPKPEPLD